MIVSNGIPNPSAGGPPSLDLRQLLICAKESFVESVGTTVETEMDVDDVEMMCVSLMDQVRPLLSVFHLERRAEGIDRSAGIYQRVYLAF